MDTFYLLPVKQYLTKRNLYLAFTYCLIYYQLCKHKYSYIKDGYTHANACACVHLYELCMYTHPWYMLYTLLIKIYKIYMR